MEPLDVKFKALRAAISAAVKLKAKIPRSSAVNAATVAGSHPVATAIVAPRCLTQTPQICAGVELYLAARALTAGCVKGQPFITEKALYVMLRCCAQAMVASSCLAIDIAAISTAGLWVVAMRGSICWPSKNIQGRAVAAQAGDEGEVKKGCVRVCVCTCVRPSVRACAGTHI